MSRPIAWLYGASAAPLVLFALTGPVSAQVTFEWATVGNPCNAPDPLNSETIPSIGAVCYVYRISKHEVTNAQYAAFLNAVAAADTNALYSTSMDTDARGEIARGGSAGKYTYSVKPNLGDKPVNFVSFFDAMRFVNWLHNRQPTGAQDFGTTEAGAYFITDERSEREWGATFFIPSHNEWYKAAYHQPADAGGDADNYWLYPTAGNDAPTIATATETGEVANPGTNVANYNGGADWNGLNSNLTTVGSAGPASTSYYGTFDQGGNVSEWNEAVDPVRGRALRGGFYGALASDLASTGLLVFLNNFQHASVGFRIASRNTGSADLDLDLDVDLRDYAHFQNQLGGPK